MKMTLGYQEFTGQCLSNGDVKTLLEMFCCVRLEAYSSSAFLLFLYAGC